jgi:hypothetical protein
MDGLNTEKERSRHDFSQGERENTTPVRMPVSGSFSAEQQRRSGRPD